MEDNQKELINKVLLLMNYDNKKTLTENKKNILNEQIPGSTHPLPLNWKNNIPLPKVGEWLPNTDSRILNNKIKDNFRKDKEGNGAYFIPTGGENSDGDYLQPFYMWDSKVYSDKNGDQYIKMEEWVEDPKSTNVMWGYKKTGNSKDFYLTKNGKKIKENPFTMRGSGKNQRVDYNNIETKGSDIFLDKNGNIKDPDKNLKEFLNRLDTTNVKEKKEFDSLLNAWVNYLMSKNLTELLGVYDKVVSFGKGGNTKDLPNYGKGTTTLGSIVLENEIYNRKSQAGQNPPKPEDIDGKSKYGIPQGYFIKTATDLYNSLYESKPNESDGNEFRGWFIKQYPDKAKNPCGDGENLDPEGKYDNKYILCAAEYKPKGSDKTAYQLFKQTKEQKNVTMDAGPKLSDKYSLDSENLGVVNKNCIPFCFLNDDELKVFKSCIGNPSSEEWKYLEQSWYANAMENTDNSKEALSTAIRLKLFSCQPLKISKENAEFLSQKIDNKIYGKLTKMIGAQDVQGQSRRAKEQKIENEAQKQEFYKWVIKQQRVTNIYDIKWLECTIGLKTEDECGDTPYCGRAGKDFLEKIARGELKTTKGKTVGNPYRDSGGNIKHYIPDTYDGSSMDNQWDIPCSSDFWDEWGGTIQIGAAIAGVIASTILAGPLGATETLALLAELSIDAAAGSYALYQSVKEKNNVDIAANAVFLALPFLLDLPATDKLFKEFKYGKTNISNLNDKFNAFKLSNPQYTSDELSTWMKNLNGHELATFNKVISKSETDKYFQSQLKDAIKKQSDLMAGAKLTGARYWVPNSTMLKMLIYVGPMAGYIFAIRNKSIKDNLIRLQNNKKLTVQQVIAWDAALMGLTNDQYLELANRIKNNPNYFVEQSNTPEFKNLEKTKKQLENTKITEEDAKRFEDEFNKNVELLLKQQNLDGDKPTVSSTSEEIPNPETSNGIEINPNDVEKYEDEGYTVRKDASTKKYYAYK